MRKEVRLLRGKALDSLVLAVEMFNRPSDRGRPDAVLISLDHSFEMLLKSALVHRGGRIREPRAKQTIGFDACVRRALSDGDVRFLGTEQALTLQTINALRDAAQHYLLEISEQQLYLHAQAGVTLFSDILKDVFGESLGQHLPERVLPVSVSPPRDLSVLMADEVREMAALLQPGTRRRVEARSRVRALAIMEGSVQGERVQPGRGDLDRILDRIASGDDWTEIFPGVASLRLDTTGGGIPFSLRIVKAEEAFPIRVVKEVDHPGAAVVAIRRVNELDFYNLGLNQLALHVGLTPPRTLAVVRHLALQEDEDSFKVLRIGTAAHKRYSQHAIERIRDALPELDLDAVWEAHRPRRAPRD